MEIKDIIRSRRIELGFTMKELADLCGVSEGTISRWESGHISNMKRDKVALLSKVLGIPAEVIMGWENDVDRFEKTANAFNKAHTYFLTGRIEAHMKDYQKLNDAFKDRIDSLTKALLSAQEAEEDLLLAAHVRTDITPTNEDKLHDISIVKQMRDDD